MAHDLKWEYREWIVELVGNVRKEKKFNKLLDFLDTIPFINETYSDMNRAEDGINLRYRFGFDRRYPDFKIKKEIDIRPCSILEMMVALAYRCEESIMTTPGAENRTNFWFWEMIDSLGLSEMDDEHFSSFFVRNKIYLFLNNHYKKNGEGGLFTIKDESIDMRQMDIWYQMMAYLNEYLA